MTPETPIIVGHVGWSPDYKTPKMPPDSLGSPSCSPSSIPGAAWHDEYLKASDRAIRMERQRDAAVLLVGELVAIIRVNAMRGTWAEATPEQVDEFLVPWIAKLRVAQGHSPENASLSHGDESGRPILTQLPIKMKTSTTERSPLGSGTCSVLFLDVDGVLNRCGKSNQGLMTDKCDLLTHICRMTGCKVVVSSTWRKYPHLMERLAGMFRARGIDCIGRTPEMVSERKLLDQSMLYTAKPRHMEITAWLAAHPEVTQYAIVDDDQDADDGTGRYVRTDSYEGLLDSHATAIMRLLSPLNARAMTPGANE